MKSDFDCIFVNGIEKQSIWHLEFRKTDPIWQFGEGFKLRKNGNFRKRGSFGDKNSAAPLANLALIQASSSPDSSEGRGKKNLAPNDPVAPRYGRLGETDLGEKSHFSDRGWYGIWRCAKTTLSYAAAPRPNRGPTVALRYVLCGFEHVFVWSYNGGRQVEGFGACCQR